MGSPSAVDSHTARRRSPSDKPLTSAHQASRSIGDAEDGPKSIEVLDRRPQRVVVGFGKGLHDVPMLGHHPVGVEPQEVGDHHRRQQLVEDHEVATGEQLDRSPVAPTRPLPGDLVEVVAQPFAPLADPRRVLDVVLGDVAVDE
jgi:hypothetical protein